MTSHRGLLQLLGRWPVVATIFLVGLFLYLQSARLTHTARVTLEQTRPSVADTVTAGGKSSFKTRT